VQIEISLQPDGTFSPTANNESMIKTNFLEKNRIAPQHFEPMQLLGTGSFGEVYLVRKRSSGIFYAMKIQSKHKIISNNLVKYA
jgi:serine/threonine protein kinase